MEFNNQEVKIKNYMYIKTLLSILLVAGSTYTAFGADIEWFKGTRPVSYHVEGQTSPVVSVALDMFTQDLNAVTGMRPEAQSVDKATIQIVQIDKASTAARNALRRQSVPVDTLAGRKDGFSISTSNGKIIIAGNNGRGTAYGILELSRMAGVSPWVWWSDVHPQKRTRLTLKDGFSTLQSPSVEYRGIFLNDEDWSLQPWSWKTFEKGAPKGRIGARTYKEIFKLLLRLRANAIWPGMHGITTPFYLVPGAKETADSCGIVIGTSHCEPLMRNNVGEWKEKERGPYNYITNRAAVENYWTERLKEAGRFENMYTIGMRGIHDGHMEGVKTMTEKVTALQQVIDNQRKLLARYVNKDVERIPQVFVPYKEVLDIMENGLRVPDDVTLMWCDDNYGYMTRLSDEQQRKRSGGAGVYYHLSYWGRPHDYMWLCTTQPGLIYNEMRQAYDSNARRVWIVNVHDLKPSAYNLELFLDMAWNIDCTGPSTLNNHLETWLCREFGTTAGRRLLPAMLEFYRLCGIRKPEHMGWTQVELDRRRYPRGRSQVINTEFSLTAFGGELDRYLEDYASVVKTVADVESMIDPQLRDAYFSHIKYQTFAAEAMARKMLEAQRARSYATGQCDATLWTREDAMLTACAKSMKGYRDIQNLTTHYNDTMAAGRWKYSMCYNPRDLYVFDPPTLPIGLTDKQVSEYSDKRSSAGKHPVSAGKTIAMNACRHDYATPGAHPVQALGHSMAAVSLPKDGELKYTFDSKWQGAAVLNVAVIPTQPNDKGDIRFSVSLDGAAPVVCSFRQKGRTPTWKENVLRGQAVKKLDVKLTKGSHTLTIKALDNHVVIDQWMIDFEPSRKYYVFPLKGENQI